MDDHVLPQGLLAIATLGLVPSSLERPPPHLCFPFQYSMFLTQKEQPTSTEAAEEDEAKQVEALLPETGDKNGNTSFSPGGLPPPDQKVEAAGGGGGGGGAENQREKKARTLTGVVRKVLRRRGSKAGDAVAIDVGEPAAGLPAGGGSGEDHSKLYYKLLKIFHKKVHPDSSIARKEHKSSRFGTSLGAAFSSDGGGSDDEASRASSKANRKEGDFCHLRRWTHPLESVSLESISCRSDSNGRAEHWIKTDRDYLVLEL